MQRSVTYSSRMALSSHAVVACVDAKHATPLLAAGFEAVDLISLWPWWARALTWLPGVRRRIFDLVRESALTALTHGDGPR